MGLGLGLGLRLRMERSFALAEEQKERMCGASNGLSTFRNPTRLRK